MVSEFWVYFFMALFSVPGSEKCETRPEICPDVYDPVCGVYPCYGDEYCTKTFSNGCYACGDEDVIAYRPGDCASPGGPHQNNPGNVNDFVDEPICKFFLVDDGGIRTEDLKNNRDVEHFPLFFYIPGKCEDMDKTVCPDSDRERLCSSRYDPVCGYYYNTNEGRIYPVDIGGITRQNACVACNDVNVGFYVKGPCEGSSPPPSDKGSTKATKTNTKKASARVYKSRRTKSG